MKQDFLTYEVEGQVSLCPRGIESGRLRPRRATCCGRRSGKVRMTVAENGRITFEKATNPTTEAIPKYRTLHGTVSRTKGGKIRVQFEFPIDDLLLYTLESELTEVINYAFNHKFELTFQ